MRPFDKQDILKHPLTTVLIESSYMQTPTTVTTLKLWCLVILLL